MRSLHNIIKYNQLRAYLDSLENQSMRNNLTQVEVHSISMKRLRVIRQLNKLYNDIVSAGNEDLLSKHEVKK